MENESENKGKAQMALRFSPEKLRYLRKRKGWTLNELAFRLQRQCNPLDLKPTAALISQWERGRGTLRGDYLLNLSVVLGVIPEELSDKVV
jgi:transcriptional regulator with XRE-family HTH domain